MKHLLTILFVALIFSFAQGQNTNSTQVRFFPVKTAGDSAATVANDGRMWYDFTTDEFRGTKAGTNFSFGSGSASIFPRYFNVETYGAEHDGLIVDDGAINSSSTTLTSASALFTASDVGDVILVSGAGVGGLPLKTTVATYVSTTQVTLSLAASTTVTGSKITWGDDDTAAIQAAINAAYAAGGGIVYFPNGIYIINGALQTSVGGLNPNSQLYIPYTTITEPTFARAQVKLLGESTVTQPIGYTTISYVGVILQSTLITSSGTNPSLLGGIGTGGPPLNFNDLYIENLQFRVYTNNGGFAPKISGVNGLNFNKASLFNAVASADVPFNDLFNPVGTGRFGFAICQKSDTGPNNIYESDVLGGFEYGFVIGEHTDMVNTQVFGCYNGYLILNGNFPINGTVLAHACYNQLTFQNGSILGVPPDTGKNWINLNFETEYDTHAPPLWWESTMFFTDPGNNSYGNLYYSSVDIGGTVLSNYTGGAHLNLVPAGYIIGPKYNSAGGPPTVSSGGSSAGNLNAIFEIGTGEATSNDTKYSLIQQVTNQSGVVLNAVGIYQVLNSAIAGADKRLYIHNTVANGTTDTGNVYEFLNNAGTLTNVLIKEPTRYGFQSGVNINVAAKQYIGSATTTPTAYLHLAAGTATASTAPLKLTSGTINTTAEAGAIEYNGTGFYGTNSTGRGIFFNENATSYSLGISALAGATRSISAVGSASNISTQINSKGIGDVLLSVGGSSFTQQLSADAVYFSGQHATIPYTLRTAGTVTGGDGRDILISGTPVVSANKGGDVILESAQGGTTYGDIVIDTHVLGTLKINTGANEQCGTATLVGGTITVNNTKVTASSIILITIQAPGGTLGATYISARVASTSFTITSTSALDTSTVGWLIIEPH